MTKAGKIGLLYPPEREVYKLRLGLEEGESILDFPCVRCGGPGGAKITRFSVRDRGTKCSNVEERAIHTRCIPSGSAPIGLRARGRNSTQVRAGRL